MLGTTPYLKFISDILLDDEAEYSKKIYSILFNKIKSEKCVLLEPDEFIKIIKDNMQNKLDKYFGFLKSEVTVHSSFVRSRKKGKAICHEYVANYCD